MSDTDKPDVELVYGDPVAFPTPTIYPNITRRQLRLWLHGAGVPASAVTASIAAIEDENERAIATIEWEDATTFERNHPLIVSIGTGLGFTPEQLDAAWLQAATL